MSFFEDEDPFDDILREFFGANSRGRRTKEPFIRGEEEDRVIDYVEDDEKLYLIFELPGFTDKDISIKVKNREIEITAKKENEDNIQDYLNQKLRQGIVIRKRLPDYIDIENMTYYVNNGILEIVFNKLKGVEKVKDGSKRIKIN